MKRLLPGLMLGIASDSAPAMADEGTQRFSGPVYASRIGLNRRWK